MKLALPRILLLTLAGSGGLLHAATPPAPPVPQQEITRAIELRLMERDYFAAESQQLEHDLPRFGALEPYRFDPAAPMPEAPKGHSAVAADGGLLFDNRNSCLSYIGNVRLNDERVQLRAAHRLFVRLPEKAKPDADEPNKQKSAQPPAEQQNAAKPDAPKANKPTPAEQADKKPEPTDAKPTKKQVAATEPGLIIAENAAVDLRDSKMLLEGLADGAPSLSLTRGSDSIVLNKAADGSPAKIFADYQGDVLMQGSKITFTWHDAKGETWQLVSDKGPVYYKAEQHCLIVPGKAKLTAPGRTLRTEQALYLVFAPAEEQPAAKNTPFSQFLNMRFKDVEYMDAYGNVLMVGNAAEGRPRTTLRGDALHYEAATGKSRIIGDPVLTYGKNSLATTEEIELLENGDAIIRGENVVGTYERLYTAAGGAATPLVGDYTAKGPITYEAERNCVLLPAGISASDKHGSFSCTGPAEVYLLAKEGAAPKPARDGMRMPNLTIAQQSDISRIVAKGEVRAHSDASANGEACDLSGDELDMDLQRTTALLTAEGNTRVQTRYGKHVLTAQAAGGKTAAVRLQENGDIEAKGSMITAVVPGDEGDTTVTCRESMYLAREKNILTLGPDSKIQTPQTIMTARAPLRAELAAGDKPTAAPAKRPHLQYNIGGLKRATTPSGGSVRTAQASLQCDGALEIALKPGSQAKSSAGARDNLSAAKAVGKVRLAGKDPNGRLMRATGDRLDFDPATKNFLLRGEIVTLVDAHNTHSAMGKGACITIDPRNNVRVTGEKQITTAGKVPEQMDNMKKKK